MALTIILIVVGLLMGGFFKPSFCKGAGAVCLGFGLLLLAWHFRIFFGWTIAAIMLVFVFLLLSPFLVGLFVECLCALLLILLVALLLGSPFIIVGIAIILFAGALGAGALGMLKRSRPFKKMRRG